MGCPSMRWLVPTVNSAAVDRLCQELNIPSVVARLLVLRGIEDPESAHCFLHPSLNQLHNPFLMAGMGTTLRRPPRGPSPPAGGLGGLRLEALWERSRGGWV